MATVARRTCQALRRVEKHAASRQSADCVEVLAALSSRLLLVGAWDSRSASAQNSQGLNPAALTSVAARGSPGSSADVARSGALLPSALWQPQRQRDSADEPSAVSPVSSTLRRGPRAAPALQLPTTTRGFCDTASRAGSSSAGSGPPTPSSGGLKPSATPAVTEPAEGYDETAGWSYDLINLPNSLSVARGLSGPLIASWIMQGNAEAALVGIAAAGASDWADGYLARQMKTSSVLGSYLDPLADKVRGPLGQSVRISALMFAPTHPGKQPALLANGSIASSGARHKDACAPSLPTVCLRLASACVTHC